MNYVYKCYYIYVIKKITRHYLARRISSLNGDAFFLCQEEKVMDKYEVIKFKDNEFEMDVNV